MKGVRFSVLVGCLLLVAVLCAAKAPPGKKFPYLSDGLNENVTVTRAELDALKARFVAAEPVKLGARVIAVEGSMILGPEHATLKYAVVVDGKKYIGASILRGACTQAFLGWKVGRSPKPGRPFAVEDEKLAVELWAKGKLVARRNPVDGKITTALDGKRN